MPFLITHAFNAVIGHNCNLAIMFARYKSTLGSNFCLCVSRFGFSKSAFLNGSININYVIRHHCLSVTDNNQFYVAQFMRESI